MPNKFDKSSESKNTAPPESGASCIWDSNLILILIYFFIFLFAICYLLPAEQSKKSFSKIDRTKLYDLYRVDGRTFKKWIHFFLPTFEEVFKTKQKIHILDTLLITFTLGLPNEEAPVLSKGMIIQKGEGSYRSLRQSIEQNNHLWPIEKEAFKQLSVFPPLVSQMLLEVYG